MCSLLFDLFDLWNRARTLIISGHFCPLVREFHIDKREWESWSFCYQCAPFGGFQQSVWWFFCLFVCLFVCWCSVPVVHTASPATAFAVWVPSPAHVCSSKMASQAPIPATVYTPRSLAHWLTPLTSSACIFLLFVAGRGVPQARSILCEAQTSVSFPGCRTKCHPGSHSYSFCNEIWCQSQAWGGKAILWMLCSIPKMPFASPLPHV